jgi:AraC-like DNA-binding protein
VLRPTLSPHSAAFVAYCLGQGTGASVEQGAAALGVTRKTLVNRFAREGLIPPREILAWCRLLHAAYLLDDSGRSLEQVGLAIGCGSGTALRNLFVRHARVRPDAIRTGGALSATLERFAASVRSRTTSERTRVTTEFPATTDFVLAATPRGEDDNHILMAEGL